MATPQEIAALRLLIAETSTTAPYDDATLGALLDASTDQYAAAAIVWDQKAAGVAGLVDISEGGSTRKNGDLYEQYLSMGSTMRSRSAALPTSGVGLRISRLTRA